MRYFDLHCDTIYESLVKARDISDSSFHITPKKSDYLSAYIQCYAICVPEELTGERAVDMFKKAYGRLVEQCKKFGIAVIRCCEDIKRIAENGGKGAVFTVENASVLAGDIKNIELFKEFNVKFVTLTWNGRNELGDGAMVSHSNGITEKATFFMRRAMLILPALIVLLLFKDNVEEFELVKSENLKTYNGNG